MVERSWRREATGRRTRRQWWWPYYPATQLYL